MKNSTELNSDTLTQSWRPIKAAREFMTSEFETSNFDLTEEQTQKINQLAAEVLERALYSGNSREFRRLFAIATELQIGFGPDSVFTQVLADYAEQDINNSVLYKQDYVRLAQVHLTEQGNLSPEKMIAHFKKSSELIRQLTTFDQDGVARLIHERNVYSFWLLPLEEWKKQIEEYSEQLDRVVLVSFWQDQDQHGETLVQLFKEVREQGISPVFVDSAKHLEQPSVIIARALRSIGTVQNSSVKAIVLQGHGSSTKLDVSSTVKLTSEQIVQTAQRWISRFTSQGIDALQSVPVVLDICNAHNQSETQTTLAQHIKRVTNGAVFASDSYTSALALEFSPYTKELVEAKADQSSTESFSWKRIDQLAKEFYLGTRHKLGFTKRTPLQMVE